MSMELFNIKTKLKTFNYYIINVQKYRINNDTYIVSPTVVYRCMKYTKDRQTKQGIQHYKGPQYNTV